MAAALDPRFDLDTEAAGLMVYVDASPTPFHAVVQAGWLLEEAGFVRVDETDPFPTVAGRFYLVRGGSLVAWSTDGQLAPSTPFRVVAAHTDSPNLRLKANPDSSCVGWQQLGVEVYGGPLLPTWLDRDLGLSGRVAVRDREAPGGVGHRLLTGSDPLLRVAMLAIHLDRTANDGLALDRQRHLAPVWGLGQAPGDVVEWLAEQVGIARRDVLGWDVMTHDTQPSARLGRSGELLAAPRLDNLGTSYAGTRALVEAVGDPGDRPAHVPVLVLFDHEEVGSTSERGAQSTMLPTVLERVVASLGGTREDLLRALAGTVVASGDMSHATHPNWPERHEPSHHVRADGGPVLKLNAQLRYASDALGAGAFRLACEQAGTPMQSYIHRTDLPCGSTVGPMTAAVTGALTVDVGAPMLSMHSCRELMAAHAVAPYAAALAAFLVPAR